MIDEITGDHFLPTPSGDHVACTIRQWAKYRKTSKHVEHTTVGDVRVSTVFLGIDHGCGMGEPVLYETMTFGGEYNMCMSRYDTRLEAKKGHAVAVRLVRLAVSL